MNAAHYDPELPFLADLEKHVRAHAEQTLRASRASAQSLSSTPHVWPWGPLAARMTRRTAILVGLLCLLAASALGARNVFFTTSESPVVVHQGALVVVARGHEGGEQWTLRLYTRDGQLCRALAVVGEAEASRCAPSPAASKLAVTSVSSARKSYIFGVAGRRVRAVRVHSGHTTLTVETHTPGGRRAHLAGLSSSSRYFVASLQRPLGNGDPTALVTGVDAAGRPIDKRQLVCFGETGPPPCGP
jgi:hypothetical protein